MIPPVAILAGGLATRMRPITETIPKAMIPVAGEPFIAHQLRKLAREGVSRVVMCVGYRASQISDFVGDGGAYGLAVAYVEDGPVLLGTGGALRNALPHLGERFLVTWGDSYLDIPYAPVVDAWRASGLPAMMTVLRNEGRWDASNVVFGDGRVLVYDKRNRTPDMAWIDYGLLGFAADAVRRIPEAHAFDLADLQHDLARDGRMAGYEVTKRFYEIGSPDGLADAEAYLRSATG